MNFSKLILPFLLLTTTAATAQIPAPTLRCVKRDTLIWDVPTVACGTINSYLIYAARNPNGPYQLLATITNANQTRYFHNNIDGGQWFYYIQTDANCAGQTRRSSDTLDNQPPVLNPVLVATVIDNRTVEVRWRRNASSKVVSYIVYKQTASGFVAIANVPNRDTIHYFDRTATPSVKSEIYQVLAVDNCGSTSLFDVSHNTILLRATQSKCAQTMRLQWNLYKNWTNPIDHHEIWLGVNGRSPYLLASVGAADTVFTVNNVNDKDRYNFFIRAVQSITSISSRSNDTTVVADIIQPVKTLLLKNVTVNDKNQVEIVWRWNANAKLDSVRILRGTSADSFAEISRFKPTFPLDDETFYVDTSARPDRQSYFYKIETKDDCGGRRTSNFAATMFLKVTPAGGRKNRMMWDSLRFQGASDPTLFRYQPYRIIANAATPIGLPLEDTKREFIDNVGIDEPKVCYRVGGKYKYTLPDGSTEDAESQSNVVCVEQSTTFFLPNAFTPGGKNPEFRPLFAYPDNIGAYSMDIFDRWGSPIFSTTTPTTGWDGRRGTEDLPQGAYAYIVRVTQANGNVVEQKGVVVLLR